MGLYNAIFGKNPMSNGLLAVLKCTCGLVQFRARAAEARRNG